MSAALSLTCPRCGFVASLGRGELAAAGEAEAVKISDAEAARRVRVALRVAVEEFCPPALQRVPLGVLARLTDGQARAIGERIMGLLLMPGDLA